MITLNDYLYSGDTVLRILHKYSEDLEKSALETNNSIDRLHCNFLQQQIELLEHNDFLTSQSQRIRDLIAYRIIVSMPQCHLREGDIREEVELDYLYRIANVLPDFLEERGFSVQISEIDGFKASDRLNPEYRPYFRDYIVNPGGYGYRSLHITLYDNIAGCYIEVQLRTKEMDDYAEIGPANHLGYEKKQEKERTRRHDIPEGECLYFDEAFYREVLLQNLELSKVDVNMFAAADNSLINDGCGLYRGRLILPFEHLSRFQNDIID